MTRKKCHGLAISRITSWICQSRHKLRCVVHGMEISISCKSDLFGILTHFNQYAFRSMPFTNDGSSDHSKLPTLGRLAVANGPCWVEIHHLVSVGIKVRYVIIYVMMWNRASDHDIHCQILTKRWFYAFLFLNYVSRKIISFPNECEPHS